MRPPPTKKKVASRTAATATSAEASPAPIATSPSTSRSAPLARARSTPAPPPPIASSSKTVLCHCNATAGERTVVKEGPNKGRRFRKCGKGEECDFFEWIDGPLEQGSAATTSGGPWQSVTSRTVRPPQLATNKRFTHVLFRPHRSLMFCEQIIMQTRPPQRPNDANAILLRCKRLLSGRVRLRVANTGHVPNRNAGISSGMRNPARPVVAERDQTNAIRCVGQKDHFCIYVDCA